jgi:putative FmdB family regulatory protein
MPLYQFYCEKCDNVFDEMVHLNGKKPPSRRKCPECHKSAKRFYNVDIGVKVGGITEKTKRVGREFAEKGFNKQQAHEFYETHIEATKERQKTGWQHYKPYDPNFKVLEQKGLVKKTSNREAKIKAAENVGKELAKRGPRNPHPQ